jgi:hypothetical protein
MRIVSSGNVGIGVTPSAWSTVSNRKVLQMLGPSMWGTQGVGYWSVNTFFSDNAFKYIASDVASRYSQVNGAHQWSSAPAGTAGENATFNTGMRLNANGRLGIGTITTPVEVTLSSASTLGWEQGSTSTIANIFRQSSSASLVLGSGVKHSTNSNAFASSYDFSWARSAVVVGFGAITFNVAPEAAVAIGTDTTVNERMRIDSSGRVTKPAQPAFQAHGVGGGTFASGSVHIYPTTRFNVGGHYNAANGRFTAPVAGIYLFGWTHIAGNVNDTYRYRLRKNGVNLDDVHLRMDTTATGTEYATNGVYTFPISLIASDYIEIFFASDGGNADYPSTNDNSNNYPLFWGYLLG